MKFFISPILLGLAAIAGVTASPVPSAEIAPLSDDAISHAPALGVPGDFERTSHPEFSQENEVAIVPRALSDEAASGIAKRATDSFFKIHVVNAAGRVLGIIVIDYIINTLPGDHESIQAFFDKLTNVKTDGPIVATHFEGGANPFKPAQNAVFDFSTKMVSGVIDLTLNAAGTAVGVASTAGIELGNLVVAKALHIFNDKNQKIGSVSL
ncbi:hypothetical protein FBEOM_12595 [Fusarium beomiforme]|uniref:Uncharacterized protein n=1 Tax=Fusarium beomiforme TaxID=44412 RepID=A0A9P5DQ89_9HYPO|nr:hypothetical protein FBEOM_12595 [Fusarium beomiforme]